MEKYNTPSQTELQDHEKSLHMLHIHYSRERSSRTDPDSSADRHEKSLLSRDQEVPVVHHVNKRFWKALDYKI